MCRQEEMEQDGDILLKMYDPIWQILYIQSTIYGLKYIYNSTYILSNKSNFFKKGTKVYYFIHSTRYYGSK